MLFSEIVRIYWLLTRKKGKLTRFASELEKIGSISDEN